MYLGVALIRDVRRQVRAHTPEEEEEEKHWQGFTPPLFLAYLEVEYLCLADER
jgi:hypothetical protein